MNKEKSKYLYKKFAHFENPNIIRQKIYEYICNTEIEKCKYIVKNYKIKKLELENKIIEWVNRLNQIQSIKEVLNIKDYSIAYNAMFYYNPKLVIELQKDMNKLDNEYAWSKWKLKEYYKN